MEHGRHDARGFARGFWCFDTSYCPQSSCPYRPSTNAACNASPSLDDFWAHKAQRQPTLSMSGGVKQVVFSPHMQASDKASLPLTTLFAGFTCSYHIYCNYDLINCYIIIYIYIYVVDRRLNSELLIAHSFWDDHPNWAQWSPGKPVMSTEKYQGSQLLFFLGDHLSELSPICELISTYWGGARILDHALCHVQRHYVWFVRMIILIILQCCPIPASPAHANHASIPWVLHIDRGWKQDEPPPRQGPKLPQLPNVLSARMHIADKNSSNFFITAPGSVSKLRFYWRGRCEEVRVGFTLKDTASREGSVAIFCAVD
jgi:hypothetical protein